MSQTKHEESDISLASDLIWGVDGPNGIAAFLGIDTRKAHYLIETGKLPVQKHGRRTITARRTELRRHFASESA